MNRTMPAVSFAALLLVAPLTTTTGQEPPATIRSDVLIGPRSGGGMSRYYPGRWNLLRLRLINRGDSPATLQSTSFASEDSSEQYGRIVWLPSHAALETCYPIRFPPKTDSKQNSVDLRTLTTRADQSAEVLVRDDWGKLEGSNLLPLTEPRAVTGIVRPLGFPPEEREYDQVLELIAASRRTTFLPSPVHEMGDAFLPPTVEGFQAFDQFVVADSRIGRDEAALAAIRLWLASGRRLWLMLDQIDAATVENLLGESCKLSEIDRVGLTTIRLQWTGTNNEDRIATSDHERPVTFVRVIPGDVEVVCTIDGWPAAFWLNYGAGRILVTTLGARGWLEQQPGLPPQLHGPATELASQFFAPETVRRPLPKAMEPVVQDYVGYAIPERRLVTGLLGGFTLVLVVMGLGLWRCGRIEQFGVYGPLLGLAVGAVLVGIGLQQRQAAAPTSVRLQIAEVLPDGEAAQLRGVSGVYRPDGGPAVLEGIHGGWLTPDTTGLAGVTRRLLWSDLDQWHWDNIQQPAGLRVAEFETSSRFAAPFQVRATCGPDGILGRVSLPAEMHPEDAVVVTADGRIGATLNPDGTFSAASAAVFSSQQFVAADVLSDEQRRRARVLESLRTDSAWIGYPHEPMLAFWTPPLEDGLRFGPGLNGLGAALIFAPLGLTRPDPGADIVIPSPLISYREGRGPDGSEPQGLFDRRSRQWQERSGPSAAWLQCQLPPALGLLKLQRVSVVVRVAGPVGRLELAGWKDGRRTVLQNWKAPVGTLTAELSDLTALPVSRDGTFRISVSGGEPAPEGESEEMLRARMMQKEYWRIESLSLTILATPVPDAPVDTALPREAG